MELWIARNSGKWGCLNLFFSKPTKKLDGSFQASVCEPYYIQLNDNEFPEVTPENSPRKVELKLAEYGISD